MSEEEFLKKLAKIVLKTVNDQGRGFRTRVNNLGHFNRGIFMPEAMFHRDGPVLIRFILNLAAGMPKEDFMRMTSEMAEFFCEVAEGNDITIINNEHDGKKS